MDPFHVICETCRARLKIRSESVIGEIHACPKCESMVHIVPPPGWVPSTVAAVAADSSAVGPVEVVSADVTAADHEIRALLQRGDQPRHIGRIVGEVGVHLEYRIRLKLIERIAHAADVGGAETLFRAFEKMNVRAALTM